MTARPKPGIEREMILKVREEHAASFVGSGGVSVLSTPSMIALAPLEKPNIELILPTFGALTCLSTVLELEVLYLLK